MEWGIMKAAINHPLIRHCWQLTLKDTHPRTSSFIRYIVSHDRYGTDR